MTPREAADKIAKQLSRAERRKMSEGFSYTIEIVEFFARKCPRFASLGWSQSQIETIADLVHRTIFVGAGLTDSQSQQLADAEHLGDHATVNSLRKLAGHEDWNDVKPGDVRTMGGKQYRKQQDGSWKKA